MTTHTSDESNNSMHAPDMHTEGGYVVVGEGVFSSFRLTSSTRIFCVLSSVLPLCNQLLWSRGFLSAIVLEEAKILQRQTNKSQQG